MGRHQDPDTLQFIEWLKNKGRIMGYVSKTEYSIGGNYFIDVVWKYRENLHPVITFEIETYAGNSIFKNTAKLYGTRQAILKKTWHHFAIVFKNSLTTGQYDALHRDLDHQNISLYQTLFNDPDLKKTLEDELTKFDFTQLDSSLITSYRSNSLFYVSDIEFALHQFGEDIPYLFKSDYVEFDKAHPYNEMKKYPDYFRNRIWKIRRESDLNQEDIEALISIVKVATTITAKENLLLSNGVCPKCGKKIGQRQVYHGGTEEDPVPYAVTYIVGCEECDYELNRETIDL